jgi:hypothetical protein
MNAKQAEAYRTFWNLTPPMTRGSVTPAFIDSFVLYRFAFGCSVITERIGKRVRIPRGRATVMGTRFRS